MNLTTRSNQPCERSPQNFFRQELLPNVTHRKAPIAAQHSAGSCHLIQHIAAQQKSPCLRQERKKKKSHPNCKALLNRARATAPGVRQSTRALYESQLPVCMNKGEIHRALPQHHNNQLSWVLFSKGHCSSNNPRPHKHWDVALPNPALSAEDSPIPAVPSTEQLSLRFTPPTFPAWQLCHY